MIDRKSILFNKWLFVFDTKCTVYFKKGKKALESEDYQFDLNN